MYINRMKYGDVKSIILWSMNQSITTQQIDDIMRLSCTAFSWYATLGVYSRHYRIALVSYLYMLSLSVKIH